MKFPFLISFAIALLVCSACGKRGRPLPPVERVPQRTELLSGVQRGNQIVLSWPVPLRNASEGNVQSIRRIDVYRLAEKIDAPLPLTEEDYASRATLIGSVDYEAIKSAGETLTYTDTLTFTGEPGRLRYALRYVNSSGQRASFSNFLLLEPAARIASPPLIAELRESEFALLVRWQAPATNIDGSTNLNIVGYNLYRSDAANSEGRNQPLNGATPFNGLEFADKNFRFGEEYRYVIRAVSVGPSGQAVESLNSNSVVVRPQDRYPPSAPTNVSLAVSPNGKVISLFFPANPERDILGYRVFRSTAETLPFDKWQKLTDEILTRTTYRDDKVEAGRKYFYYVVAVDSAGNVSPPSGVVSEIVPQ